MKISDKTKVEIVAVLLLVILIAIILIPNSKNNTIIILKSTTDTRHLTSVVYIDLKGDTIAQDYLTYKELCNLH